MGAGAWLLPVSPCCSQLCLAPGFHRCWPSATCLSPADLRCQSIVDDRGDVDWSETVGTYILHHCLQTGKLSVTIRASKETFQVAEEHLEGTNREGPWWIERNWVEDATLTNGTVSLSLLHLAKEQAPPTTPARAQGALVLGDQPTPPPLAMPGVAQLRLGKRKVSRTLAVAAAAACRERSPLRPRRLQDSLAD